MSLNRAVSIRHIQQYLGHRLRISEKTFTTDKFKMKKLFPFQQQGPIIRALLQLLNSRKKKTILIASSEIIKETISVYTLFYLKNSTDISSADKCELSLLTKGDKGQIMSECIL